MGFFNKKKRNITTTISIELDKRLQKAGIKRSYAMAYGSRVLLGDKVVNKRIDDYEGKMAKMSNRLQELVRQVWILEEKKRQE